MGPLIEIAEEEGPVIEEEAAAAGEQIASAAESLASEVEDEGKALLDKAEQLFSSGEVEETTVSCEAASSEGPQLRSDLGDDWLDEFGNPKWPPNNGAAGPEEPGVLQPGTIIDRFGGQGGTFASSPEASYAERSLPYDPATVPYGQYEVVKPLPMMESEAAPWFEQPGGAPQYRFESSIRDLIDQGYLKPK